MNKECKGLAKARPMDVDNSVGRAREVQVWVGGGWQRVREGGHLQ